MKTIVKLGSFLACILLSCQVAHAQGSQFDGPYIGIDGSYDKHTATSTAISNAPTGFVTPGTAVYNTDGPSTGIFIGYRQSVDRFTVAAEARYNYSFVSFIFFTSGNHN